MKTKSDFNVVYNKIIALIEAGHNIDSACKKLGHSRSYFYNNATDQQKHHAKCLSTLNAKCPRGTSNYYTELDNRSIPEDDDYEI